MSEKETPKKKETTEDSESAKEHKPPSIPLQSPVIISDASAAETPPRTKDTNTNGQTYQERQIAIIERQTRAAEKLNCITAWAAVVGAAGIAVLVATLLVTKQSADTAGRQLELSERPWVDLTSNNWPVDQRKLTSLRTQICVVNRGKTPASNTLIRAYIIPAMQPLNEMDINRIANCKDRKQTDAFRLNYPDEDSIPLTVAPNPIGLKCVRSAALRDLSGRAIPIDAPEIEKLREGSMELYMFGCITYDDPIGISHWTEVCLKLVRNPNPTSRAAKTWVTCRFHNAIDSNLEPDKQKEY